MSTIGHVGSGPAAGDEVGLNGIQLAAEGCCRGRAALGTFLVVEQAVIVALVDCIAVLRPMPQASRFEGVEPLVFAVRPDEAQG